MNKFIVKYIDLEITTKEFINEINNNQDLFNELKSYLPTEKTINNEKWNSFIFALSLKTHDYDLKRIIKYNFSNGITPSGKSKMYEFFYKILQVNGFNLTYKKYYRERSKLLMDILPDYVGGNEAEEYIDLFINNLDKDLTNNQMKKRIKEFIKKEFVYKNKKPIWIQEPEWPVEDKPLVFISQLKDNKGCKYLFKDVSTGMKKEITQIL